jgi:hypothetical protein
MYGDDYEKLDKYLKEHKMEDIPWFESEEGAEFAKKATERFAPLVAEIAERNKKSKAAFARLKDLVANAPIKSLIESTEKGVQGILASVKDDIGNILNLLSFPEGLTEVRAGAMRGDELKKSTITFTFEADIDYTCKNYSQR